MPHIPSYEIGRSRFFGALQKDIVIRVGADPQATRRLYPNCPLADGLKCCCDHGRVARKARATDHLFVFGVNLTADAELECSAERLNECLLSIRADGPRGCSSAETMMLGSRTTQIMRLVAAWRIVSPDGPLRSRRRSPRRTSRQGPSLEHFPTISEANRVPDPAPARAGRTLP